MARDSSAPLGWVLFDGSCGFCRSWVTYWASTLRKHGFEIAALQEYWVRKRLGSLAEEELGLPGVCGQSLSFFELVPASHAPVKRLSGV